jgi:type VI secretion system protein ImpF
MSRKFDRNDAGARASSQIKLTIMERIRQMRPESQAEKPQVVKRKDPFAPLLESIRRNLEWVLNSRRVIERPDEHLSELNRSMYVYGVHDLVGSSFDSREKNRLRAEIEELIGLFEPRLTEVTIEKGESTGPGIVRFRINGLMMVEPEPERISFGIELDPSSGEYDVKAGD